MSKPQYNIGHGNGMHASALAKPQALCDVDKTKRKGGDGPGPSASTLSRARVKLDVLAMFCRQYEWRTEGFENTAVVLCFSACQFNAT